jgi:hypothetical protein
MRKKKKNTDEQRLAAPTYPVLPRGARRGRRPPPREFVVAYPPPPPPLMELIVAYPPPSPPLMELGEAAAIHPSSPRSSLSIRSSPRSLLSPSRRQEIRPQSRREIKKVKGDGKGAFGRAPAGLAEGRGQRAKCGSFSFLPAGLHHARRPPPPRA